MKNVEYVAWKVFLYLLLPQSSKLFSLLNFLALANFDEEQNLIP